MKLSVRVLLAALTFGFIATATAHEFSEHDALKSYGSDRVALDNDNEGISDPLPKDSDTDISSDLSDHSTEFNDIGDAAVAAPDEEEEE